MSAADPPRTCFFKPSSILFISVDSGRDWNLISNAGVDSTTEVSIARAMKMVCNDEYIVVMWEEIILYSSLVSFCCDRLRLSEIVI